MHVDTVFNSCLRTQIVRPIYDYEDLFQMRTNCAYLRTCPAACFFLEGLSRLTLLLLVAFIVFETYNSNHFKSGPYIIEGFLIVMLISNLFYKIGELLQCGCLKSYFKVHNIYEWIRF